MEVIVDSAALLAPLILFCEQGVFSLTDVSLSAAWPCVKSVCYLEIDDGDNCFLEIVFKNLRDHIMNG